MAFQILIAGVVEILCAFTMALGGIIASRKLYHALVHCLLHAPLLFFERTPTGRVLSRLSEDTSTVDYVLPFTTRAMINLLLSAVSIVFVIAFTSPMFLVSLPPLVTVYFFVQVTDR